MAENKKDAIEVIEGVIKVRDAQKSEVNKKVERIEDIPNVIVVKRAKPTEAESRGTH